MKNKPAETISEYIKTFPPSVQKILKEIRGEISKTIPDAEEAIRYGMPTFRLNNKNLVHFAAFKNHIGFFPSPSGVEAFKNEIKKYKWSKGTIQFPLDRTIPLNLIRKIVRFRVREMK